MLTLIFDQLRGNPTLGLVLEPWGNPNLGSEILEENLRDMFSLGDFIRGGCLLHNIGYHVR